MPGKPVPVIVPKEGELLPSQREATIALTARYGPKTANHVPPAELSRREGRSSTTAAPKNTTPKVAAKPVKAPVPEAQTVEAPVPEAQAVEAPVPEAQAVKAPVPMVKAPVVAPVGAPPVKTAAAPVTAPKPAAKAAPTVPGKLLARERQLSSWTTVDGLLSNRIVLTALAVGATALTVVSIYKGIEMYNRHRLGMCITEMTRAEPQVVQLYIHRRSPLAPSLSVPCTQVETFLRLAGIPYVAHVISDASVSPNGQLPFIVYGKERVAGARDIIEALTSKLSVVLDEQLTREEKATGVALESALLYSFARAYTRSVHVDKPEAITPYYSEMNRTPDWMTKMALSRLRTQAQTTNDVSGYSLLTREQYQHVMEKDVVAIEGVLGGRDFLFSSSQPSSYDCALYAWLLPIVAMENAVDVNCAFEHIVQSDPLTAFVKRMTHIAFPDLDELVASGSSVAELESISEDAGKEEGSEEEHLIINDATEAYEGPRDTSAPGVLSH